MSPLRFRRTLFPLGFLFLALAAPPAFGLAQRTFVASYGNDANPCSLALPCRAFNFAIAQTISGGEVIALDSAGWAGTRARWGQVLHQRIDPGSRLAEVPRAQRRSVAKDLDHHHRYHCKWADPRKGMAATYASGNCTKEIADHSGVHNSTVSRAVKHSEKTG